MSQQDANAEQLNGRCLSCGKVWIGLSQSEYKSTVSRHIINNHREQPPDDVVVENFELKEVA